MGKIASFFIASPENDYHPPVLSYKAFLIYGLILLLLRFLLSALPVESAAVDSNTLLALVNQERANRNIPTLFTHQALLKAAAEKSQDMIDRDYFAHVDPDGNYVWTRIVAAGYTPYKVLGENLAVDFATSEGLVKAWIDSPSHRENLLNAEFVDQGLSALYGDFQGRYTNLTTNLFGTLATISRPAPQVKPKTAPPPQSQETPATPPAQQPPPVQTPPVTVTAPQTATSTSDQQRQPWNLFYPPRTDQGSEGSAGGFFLPEIKLTPYKTAFLFNSALQLSKLIFTLFGAFLLVILLIDSVIISRHEAQVVRSYSSYHLFGFLILTLLSMLIWWW